MEDSGGIVGKAGQGNLGLNLNKKEEDLPQEQSKKYQTFMNDPAPKSVQKKIQLLEKPELIGPSLCYQNYQRSRQGTNKGVKKRAGAGKRAQTKGPKEGLLEKEAKE